MGGNGRNHAHRSHFCPELHERLREWARHTERGCGASDARGPILPPCRWSTAFSVARYRRVSTVAASYRAGRGATSYDPHSGMKLPERVVFDTSAPTVAAAIAPVVAVPGAPPASFAEDVSAKARQALAQLQSSDSRKAKVAEVNVKYSQSRKSETRKGAAAPRKIRLARQPQFDWFSDRMWW